MLNDCLTIYNNDSYAHSSNNVLIDIVTYYNNEMIEFQTDFIFNLIPFYIQFLDDNNDFILIDLFYLHIKPII